MHSNNMTVKFWDYLREYKTERTAILAAVEEVFESGQLVLGDRGRAFENEIARYIGVAHGVGVNSGTDALFLALKAFGIGPGDEVITVSNTAIPTVSAITATGATPRFADVHSDTLLIDESKIEPLITRKTKAIIPVHLYGQMAEMSTISKIAAQYNLFIIEDCAQALGATQNGTKAGAASNASCFSFYPTKNLGAFGDGGMILTQSQELAEKLKRTRFYGISSQYYSVEQGYNSRLDEIQAAILSVRFKHLETSLEGRSRIATRYNDLLRTVDIQKPITAPQNVHSYHLYVCQHPKRDEIIKKMKLRGVDLAIHYPHSIHLMKGFSYLGEKPGSVPIAERAAKEVFSLPLYPALTDNEQEYVCESLRSTLKEI